MSIFSQAKSDMSFVKIDPKKLSKKGLKKRRRGQSTIAGIIISIITAVCICLFLFRMLPLGLVPNLYAILVVVILGALWAYCFISQFSRHKLIGKIVAIFLSVVSIYGFMFSSKIADSFGSMAGGNYVKKDTIDVVVLDRDKANNIEDTLKYTFAYNESSDVDLTKKTIGMINEENSSVIDTIKFSDWDDVLEALYDNTDAQAVLIKDSIYQSVIKDSYSSYYDETKVVAQYTISTEVAAATTDIDVSKDPFVVYISGNDEQGDIKSTGRSDVNILLIANPKTREILMVSTPRDSYIMVEDAEGDRGYDKLTHAGLAGIEYSEKALSELYGVPIDFYMKLNFTGVVNVVDSLGGITVNSDVEFTNGTDAAPIRYHFEKGENELDGAMTLAFCRERHNFADGDFQRGRNQMAALDGIIKKVTSPAILTNYSGVLDAFSNMVYTNMPVSSLTSLIRSQLAGGEQWHIQSYAIEGEPSVRNCQVYGLKNVSVDIVDKDTVDIATELINKTITGEKVDVEEFVASYTSTNSSTTVNSSSLYSDDDEDE